MRWIQSPLLQTVHGFSTRHGGVSPAPYQSLNLGGKDDDAANIVENRRLALADLDLTVSQVAYLDQIHSNRVCTGKPGKQTGDALVSRKKGLALAVGAADCYPVLFHDPVNGVIGAAHCGWKGTLCKIVSNTLQEMLALGAELQHTRVAIGQGISRANYEVSTDIITQFRDAGFPDNCYSGRQLDLLAANRFLALQAGVPETQVWSMNRCTTESDFFSYRRDQGKTGRMWALIVLK